MNNEVRLGAVLSSDPRSERHQGTVNGAEVELRTVTPGVPVDAAVFLSRLDSLAQLSHPSLRMVRGGVLLDDARPAAVMSLVQWPSLLSGPRLPVESLVALGADVAEALSVLHAAGLVLGQVSPVDLFPGQPAVLDASLVGLAPADALPEGDVRMLAQVLLAAGSGGGEASPFEAELQRAIAQKWTAEVLARALDTLRQRAQARTVSGRHPVVEVEVLEPQLEGVTLRHWKLERVLGEGAMARVYFGVDTRTGKSAAVKVLKQEHVVEPEFVHRFTQEIQAVNAIHNEHIVAVTDFGDEALQDGRRCVYCVMEVLEGQALAEAINVAPFTLERAVGLCRQLASALHAAHEVGVVHRDVKPENIFLVTRAGAPDFVKVLDFGVAKLLRPIGDLPRVGTKAGVVVGTPEYMAPEQAMGAPTDPRVDVYAVGLVLYELLTGAQPFTGDTFGKLVLEITQKEVPPLPERTLGGELLPPGLAAVVLTCLQKDPKDRFLSAAALEQALAPFGGPPPPVDEEALLAAVRPSRTPMYVALVVVLLLAAAVIWTFVGPTAPAPAPAPTPVAVVPPVEPVAELPSTVWLDVSSSPQGAQVKRGAEVLGVTPLRVEVPRAQPMSLSLALLNYKDETRELTPSQEGALFVELTPVPRPKVKKAPPKKKKRR